MTVNISEQMRDVLQKCVEFAIQKNAWISAIDSAGDYEVTMDDALAFLQELKQ